jgi:hypothetical protein
MKTNKVLFGLLFSAMVAAAATPVVPVSATTERRTVVTLANGNTLENTTSGRYLRDSSNRVRREEGPLITISDPIARTTVILDTRSKTGRRVVLLNRTQDPSPVVTRSGQPTTSQDLGERTIDGILTKGKQHVNVIPANGKLGNKQPIEMRTQIWYSEELQLPLLTTVSSPLSEATIRMTIESQAEPDPSLFIVPADYKISDVSPASR